MTKQTERTVIVTGAAQGIGYAIAESCINNGDFVAILDLNLEDAETQLLKCEMQKVTRWTLRMKKWLKVW